MAAIIFSLWSMLRVNHKCTELVSFISAYRSYIQDIAGRVVDIVCGIKQCSFLILHHQRTWKACCDDHITSIIEEFHILQACRHVSFLDYTEIIVSEFLCTFLHLFETCYRKKFLLSFATTIANQLSRVPTTEITTGTWMDNVAIMYLGKPCRYKLANLHEKSLILSFNPAPMDEGIEPA